MTNQGKSKSDMDVHIIKEDAATSARVKHISEKYGEKETSLAAAFDTIHQACQLGIYKMKESDGNNQGGADTLHAAQGVAKALEFVFSLAGSHLEADADKCMLAVKEFRKLKEDLRAQLFGDDDPDKRPADPDRAAAASQAVEALLAKAGQVASVVPAAFTYQNRGDS